ncbi:MAG: outer membrane beta-barrel protein [Planctomycetaceae bacterium]|nr:outer membrane beta-barrel protein [Planctomycetaceae bacterium]
MKLSRFAIAAAVAGLLMGGHAHAQQAGSRTAARAASTGFVDGQISARDISYGPKDAPEPASPSDQPMPMAPEADKEEEEEEEPTYKLHHGLFGRCLCCEEAEEEEECEPWRLFGNGCNAKCRKAKIDGWIVGGYVWNPYRPVDRFNGPQTWMDRANEVNMQELWFNFHKDVDTEGCGFDHGYNASVMYGTNARFLTAAGFEDRINKTGPFYGLAVPNLNYQFGLNDLKVTIGRFASPVGYAVIGQPNNHFNVLPYTFQYGEPFTHTGILGQYQITDDVNVGLGLVLGWDNFDKGFNRSEAMIATYTRTNVLKCGDTFAYFGIYGNEPNLDPALPSQRYGVAAPGFTPRYLQSLVYMRPINDCWSYVFQSDFGVQQEPFGPNGRQAAMWYGVNQYAYRKINDCWTWGVNAEWFRDDGGFRVGGFLPNFSNNNNGGPTGIRGLSPLRSGFDGSFYRVAIGPSYTPTKNLAMRSALVWDWYSGPAGPNGGINSLPFLNGSAPSRSQVVVTQDIVLKF